jgi:hypothetical protein
MDLNIPVDVNSGDTGPVAVSPGETTTYKLAASCGGSPVAPPAPKTTTITVTGARSSGALVITYSFTPNLGLENAPLTIRWVGSVVPQGPTGNTNPKPNFDETTNFTYDPIGPSSVASVQIDNLRNGTWDVTVQPSAVGGLVVCHNVLVLSNTVFLFINPNLPTGQQCR